MHSGLHSARGESARVCKLVPSTFVNLCTIESLECRRTINHKIEPSSCVAQLGSWPRRRSSRHEILGCSQMSCLHKGYLLMIRGICHIQTQLLLAIGESSRVTTFALLEADNGRGGSKFRMITNSSTVRFRSACGRRGLSLIFV